LKEVMAQGYVVWMGGIRRQHKILLQKPPRKFPLGWWRQIWKKNVNAPYEGNLQSCGLDLSIQEQTSSVSSDDELSGFKTMDSVKFIPFYNLIYTIWNGWVLREIWYKSRTSESTSLQSQIPLEYTVANLQPRGHVTKWMCPTCTAQFPHVTYIINSCLHSFP